MSEDWEEDPAPPGQEWKPDGFGVPSSFGRPKQDDFGLPSSFGASKRDAFGSSNEDAFGGGRGRSRDGGGGGGGRGRGGPRACFKCGDEGHMARECPTGGDSGRGGFRGRSDRGRGDRGRGGGRSFKPRNDDSSGFSGFGDNDPFGAPSGFDGGAKDERRKGCFKCGNEGHMARDCPSEGSGGASGFGDGGRKKGCFNCKEEGHNARDCPNQDSSQESQKPRVPLYVPQDVNEDELFDMGIEAGRNFDAYANIPVSVTGADPIEDPVSDFQSMKLREILLQNIQKAGYVNPTPVQKYTIPNVMIKRDIMGCAQTGSGKTAAFLLPMLHDILMNGYSGHAFEEPALPTGLVMCPTRELAMQIMREARKFSLGSVAKCCVAYGGVASFHQMKAINSGCHILVATPGRLLDFLEKGKIAFSSLKYLVLDEADRMLDMGFLPAIKSVVNHKTMTPSKERVTMMFSATFPNEIQQLAADYLHNYLFLVVGTVGAANRDVKQTVMLVPKYEKLQKLVDICEELLVLDEKEKILVFVEQKRVTDFVGAYICEKNLKATTMHGDRFQQQREEALATFRNGVHNILVATAVAARGLDIKGIGVVVNYDLPKDIDEYVHRIGRTGRLGNQGIAISFYDEETDAHVAKDLEKVLSEAKQDVPDWLSQAASTSGYSQTYHGTGLYAAADIRTKDGRSPAWQKQEASSYLGGPKKTVDDDEDWGL